MQKINKTFEESKDKKNLLKQFGKSINIFPNQIDTIPTLIPQWKGEDKSIQLKNWLEVRLGENNIRIVNQ